MKTPTKSATEIAVEKAEQKQLIDDLRTVEKSSSVENAVKALETKLQEKLQK